MSPPRVRRTERRTRLLVLLLGVPLLLYALVRSAGELVPFAPYTVHGYAAAPPEGCAGTLIHLEIDRTVTRPLWGRVESVTATTRWERGPDRGTPGGTTFTSAFTGPYGRAQVRSRQERLTPDAPGRWYLHAEVAVTGRVLLSERTQMIMYDSPELFTVLPPGDPACR